MWEISRRKSGKKPHALTCHPINVSGKSLDYPALQALPLTNRLVQCSQRDFTCEDKLQTWISCLCTSVPGKAVKIPNRTFLEAQSNLSN